MSIFIRPLFLGHSIGKSSGSRIYDSCLMHIRVPDTPCSKALPSNRRRYFSFSSHATNNWFCYKGCTNARESKGLDGHGMYGTSMLSDPSIWIVSEPIASFIVLLPFDVCFYLPSASRNVHVHHTNYTSRQEEQPGSKYTSMYCLGRKIWYRTYIWYVSYRTICIFGWRVDSSQYWRSTDHMCRSMDLSCNLLRPYDYLGIS